MSWYSSYNSGNVLEQGVILFNLPLPNIAKIRQPVEGQVDEFDFDPYNAIILTQTCDLAQNKVDRVYVCPVFTLEAYFEANPAFAVSDKSVRSEYEKLKQGHYVNRFLLNKCTSSHAKQFKDKFLVVFFDKAVILSTDYIERFLVNSKRKWFVAVKPPYREALAQHYGRYFMRIGAPIDYPNKEDINAKPYIQGPD